MREYGSEHPAIILPDGYFDSLSGLGREVLYLRSGREALLLAALSIRQDESPVILFPAYCCWAMSAPFEKAGWKTVYYRLNPDLTVDLEYFSHLLEKHRPRAVLTMNFYGSAPTQKAVGLAKEFDGSIVTIEDFSHCTFCLGQILNPQVDIYVSSLRKSVGISDGAVILSGKPLQKQYIKDEIKEFADKRYGAQTEKMLYSWSKDQQKKQQFLSDIRECEALLDGFDSVRPISERSMQMLRLLNAGQIRFARRENMRHLWTLLNGKIEMVPSLERSFDGAPFSIPILVDDRDNVQQALNRRGVYTQWVWPVCEEAQKICPVSRAINDRVLSVPVDQRFSWDDIEDMAAIIIDTVHSMNF